MSAVRVTSQAPSARPSVVWRAKVLPLRPSAPAAKEPRVSVVIPAINEAKNLEHVLPALPDGLFEVILVDGASVDATIETAKRLRPDVRIVFQTRKGKGNALACGFAASSGDIIVMLDADGSADPGEIPRFVDALVEGADFAKGSRRLEGGGSADITRVRSMGNRALSFLVNRLCQSGYTDLCYGFNAFWAKRCLPVLDLDWRSPPSPGEDGRLWGDGFEIETLINIRVAKAGLKVVEVPSYELPRLHGVSNLHAPSDGMRVLRTILKEDGRARRLGGGQRPTRPKLVVAEEPVAAEEPGAADRIDLTLDELPRYGAGFHSVRSPKETCSDRHQQPETDSRRATGR